MWLTQPVSSVRIILGSNKTSCNSCGVGLQIHTQKPDVNSEETTTNDVFSDLIPMMMPKKRKKSEKFSLISSNILRIKDLVSLRLMITFPLKPLVKIQLSTAISSKC